MPAGSGHPKRIGIFLTYDADGIVDEYVVRLLRDMRPNLDSLIILANGKLTDDGRARLAEFTDEIHVRPNEGFDSGAWQEGLLVHCGFDRLREHDELVLFNDSFFGPLYPFADVFAEMAPQAADFWGLSVHGAVKSAGQCPHGHRPRYLQTYFLVFRSRLLHAPAFREFWEHQPTLRHFYELADRFGGFLTRHFEELGFSWTAYSDTTDLEDPATNNFAHHSYNFREMVVRRRYPVIKRRTFKTPRWNHLLHGDGAQVPEVLAYVQRHYRYDLNPVYDYLLRKLDIGDLKDSLNLNFILRTGATDSPPLPAGKKVLVAALLRDPGLLPQTLPVLRDLPDGVELLIATDTAETKQAIENALAGSPAAETKIVVLPPDAGGLPALLTACGPALQASETLCFLHDRLPQKTNFPTTAANQLERLWSNTLPDAGSIRQVLAIFENHPRLGLLVPPAPYHGSFFRAALHDWPGCFDRVKKLAGQLGIRAPLKKSKPSVSSDSVFWCRTDALQPLLAGKNLDLPGRSPERFDRPLGRLLPYIAQSRGYFTGWIMTERQAAIDLTNLQFMLDQTRRSLAGTPGVRFDTFAAFRLSLANLRKLLLTPVLRAVLAGTGKLKHFAEHRSPAFIRRAWTRFFNRNP